MYFFYFDESGTRDPEVTGKRKDGTTFAKDPFYVLVAVGLYPKILLDTIEPAVKALLAGGAQ